MTDYASIKSLHIVCATLSILFFLYRGFFCFALPNQPRPRWSRVTPHVIDTFLLLSGFLLAGILQTGDFWLIVKIIAIIVYIGLGWVALKRRSLPAFIAACAVFAYIVCVAVTKSPLGPVALF